ncbi:glutamyl-tRNA synthetase [Metschnikowia bicuspidata var. bicuspidata NRRL YB-4993]|uniref:Glutamate--tRNA ligase, mitochondrial n=1 Tax=Metschnikowia bicuspidata var. bicuspidata NRRL YB-4993 TaxID=869754 RepID=A0A1A0HHG2_9ASCO|nr:glutamyl-tRNA synthetase [Metschnikowia bicuspidata var. bicuspidata NRRL YB-4993]OBA23317.1 glutamyl-tRNA synthetase [Metschnikowia bicuspidata var. bicuspidata NRRL YB-4993]
MRFSLRLLASLRPTPSIKGNPLVLLKLRPGTPGPDTKTTSGARSALKSAATAFPLLSLRKESVHPDSPARTRFAPSPTGLLHLGSLRTALYNYLLAKQTKGSFILRLEDTDQKRLVAGAEQNIYDSLKWAGLDPDESPEIGGPHGPYRQSERGHIYQKYVDVLLAKNLAYKCFCSKDRLLSLRETAQKLKPPTTVTYDRKCLHNGEESTAGHNDGQEYVIRFRAPEVYDKIEDLRHGILDLQPQYNHADRRYDDFVIMKLDGLPTYHFANVVDDHLMGITHVIRGEEWLTLTPKHVALYHAFGWSVPKFVHIPLLTSLEDKKLSKRHGDVSVSSFEKKGILPEALVNFVALFGWSPPRPEMGKKVTEVMSLKEMSQKFRLDNMTKGNVKVSENKLLFFNKQHLAQNLRDPQKSPLLIETEYQAFLERTSGQFNKDYFEKCIFIAMGHLEKLSDLLDVHPYFFKDVDFSQAKPPKKLSETITILRAITELSKELQAIISIEKIEEACPEYPTLLIMQSLRFALTGMVPGVNIADVLTAIGYETYLHRLESAIKYLLDIGKSDQ